MVFLKEHLERKLNADIAAILLCLVFTLICGNFAGKINLWGDEAFSLDLAEKSWQTVFYAVDTHSPTYALLLKLVISLTGASANCEIWIRLVHIFLFAIGLFLGYKTIYLITQSYSKALTVLLAAIFLPTFTFYATNIRMYALLFFCSMLFIYEIALILNQPNLPTKKQWFWLILSSILLLLADYPGILFYGMGVIFLLLKIIRLRQWKLMALVFLPLASYLIYLNQIIPDLELVLTWKAPFTIAKKPLNLSLQSFLKWGYQAFRPAIDLINPAAMDSRLALLIPGILILFLLLGAIALIWKAPHPRTLRILLVCSAFLWLLTIPKDLSITRVFLPSLFFMTAILVIGFSDFQVPIKWIGTGLLVLLLVINGQQIGRPTLRVYSMIPYHKIAEDCLHLAQQQKIKTILLSNHTLNSLAIKRYLEQDRRSNAVRIVLLPPNFNQATVPQNSFIFVSHMHESNQFIDVQTLEKNSHSQVENVRNYIELEQLPFNTLWKSELVGRTAQKFAVSVYVVHPELDN